MLLQVVIPKSEIGENTPLNCIFVAIFLTSSERILIKIAKKKMQVQEVFAPIFEFGGKNGQNKIQVQGVFAPIFDFRGQHVKVRKHWGIFPPKILI